MTEAIRLVISGDSKGAVKALKDVSGAATESQGAFGKYSAGLNKAANYALAGFIALEAVIIKCVTGYESFAIQVAKVNAQTGMGAEATSRFLGQLQMLHVDGSKAGMAMKTMENAIYGLKTGASASVDTFKILNLTWADLKDLKPEDQIGLIRDRLSQLQDPAARSQAATKLLGRGAKDMALWYDASAAAMAKVNTELQKNGQIMTEGQLKDAAKAALAWQDFAGALKGVEYTIARGMLPTLTRLFGALAKVLQTLRPLAPVIFPATAALGAFVVAIKGAVFFQNTWNQMLRLLPARLGAATVAEEGATVATGGLSTAMSGLLVKIGLVVAAMWALYEVYHAVKAASEAFSATRQEGQQYQGTLGNLQQAAGKITAWQAAHPGQPLPADLQRLKNTIYSAAQGAVNAHAGAAWASGTDHITNGPEVFVAGERGRERVQVTPLGKRGGGGMVLHLHQTFNGPVVGGRQGMRELSDIVKRDVMAGVQRAMVGQNA